jgi:hypothetical protein
MNSKNVTTNVKPISLQPMSKQHMLIARKEMRQSLQTTKTITWRNTCTFEDGKTKSIAKTMISVTKIENNMQNTRNCNSGLHEHLQNTRTLQRTTSKPLRNTSVHAT